MKRLHPSTGLGPMVAAARRRNAQGKPTMLDATLLGLLGKRVSGKVRQPTEPKAGSTAAKALAAMRRGPVPLGKVLTLPAHGLCNRQHAQPVVPIVQGGKLAYVVPKGAKALQALLRGRLEAAGWLTD